MNAFTMIEPANDSAPKIGTACDTPGGGLAYIVAVKPSDRATFTLFGGPEPMARDCYSVTIATESGHISEISENIAAPMIARARHAALWERAKVKRDETRAALAAEREARDLATAKAKAELQRIAPPWATSAIVAELHEDASDHYSDYHNHRVLRSVVIGWSKHNRDLFAEMRKAAATFPETAALADAPANAEHREKYSMGAGFYLKQGWRDSDGWSVKKTRIDCLGHGPLEFSDEARAWAEITAKPESPAPTVAEREASPTGGNGGRFTVTEHTHTKKGFQMWIASMGERLERSEFDSLLAAARELGGWYSRPWSGTPGGFAFKIEGNARAFVAAHGGEC